VLRKTKPWGVATGNARWARHKQRAFHFRHPAAGALVGTVAAMTLASLTSCAAFTHRTQGNLSDGKTFAVDLVYGGNALGFNVVAFADVRQGTSASVEVSGPMHWRCAAKFQAHSQDSWDQVDNLPSFRVAVAPPVGSYKVVVNIPGRGSQLTSHVEVDVHHRGVPNPVSGVWWHDPACTLVADSASQQRDYVALYTNGLRRMIDHLNEPESVRQQLRSILGNADEVLAPVLTGQDQTAAPAAHATAVERLRALSSAAGAAKSVAPVYVGSSFTLQQLQDVTNDTIEILSQPALT